MVAPDTSNKDGFITVDEEGRTSGRIPIGRYFSEQYEQILKHLNVIEEHLSKRNVITKSDWASFENQFKALQSEELEILVPIATRYLGHEAEELQKTLVSEYQQTRVWLGELMIEPVLSVRVNRCRQLSRFLDCYLVKMQAGLYKTVDGLGLELTYD